MSDTKPASVATVEPIAYVSDRRGFLTEPLRPDQLPTQRNVHLVLSAPGAVRGNHYHRRGTEVMVVVGPALIRIREAGVVRDVHVPDRQAFRFTFPPGVAHAIQSTGSSPLVFVCFNTELYDARAPDAVPDILIDPTSPAPDAGSTA
jgi:dTDP-4-dehydrorhamnose 3,5-epimerase-like enzyme